VSREPGGSLNYQQAVDYVISQTDYERLAGHNKAPPKFDLGRMEALLERLGNPQNSTPAVHVAGTKGKGSTCAIIAQVLQEAGYLTGLYTSPHLHTMRERIRLNGRLISEANFAAHVGQVKEAAEEVNATGVYSPVSTFEILTAGAFCYFKSAGAQFQVLEVGLGGRLDATNVVTPKVSVITSLSLDHMEVLGSTLHEIAGEKAGIIKRGVPLVASPQKEEALAVLKDIASERGAPLVLAGRDITWEPRSRDLKGQSFVARSRTRAYDLWMPLLGDHQLENAATALGALEQLIAEGFAISPGAIVQGFRKVSWPGRLEVLKRAPTVVVDGAHNTYSAERLAEAVMHLFSYERLILVVGMNSDKDVHGIVSALAKLRPYVVATASRYPKAAPPETLLSLFSSNGLEGEIKSSVAEAMGSALRLAGGKDMILATGSLFVVAEAIEEVKGIKAELYPTLERPKDV